MSSFWWTLFTILFAIFGPAKCQSTAFPIIPSHLVECYRDSGIYHRANRMPSSLETFLDLVRKMEESPTARNMNARELAIALMHYLKQDGIQSIQFENKYFPNNVLPHAPSGAEYFKHRLVLVGLIPRIDPSYLTILNETLSKKEMCNLHFMLSYSIEPYKRNDEKCSPLFEKSRRGTSVASTSGLDSHNNNRGSKRYRRYIDPRTNYNQISKNGVTTNSSEKFQSETMEDKLLKLNKIVLGPMRKISKSVVKSEVEERSFSTELTEILRIKKRNSNGETDKKSDAEEFLVEGQPGIQGKLFHGQKNKFIIGNQELLSDGERPLKTGMQSLIQTENFGKYGARSYPNPVHSTDENVYSRVVPGIPLSDCPVINGVVSTPFGSLTIGTVLAGIAAGLNPEEIPPARFSVGLEELESPSDRVKNIWATTLAGTVANVISSPVLLDIDNFQILKGGWNDSFDSKWYLLGNDQFKYLPEVALRGALDGLFLGLHVKEWTGKYSGFKLSQVLQIYYDSFWGKVGAKHRVQLRPEYAPDEIFRKQVRLMSLVLNKQKTHVLTVLDYNQTVKAAVGNVIQHIQTMDENEKSYIGSFLRTKIENAVKMIAVIDSSWGHESLDKIFQVLREARVASAAGNNLTIVCGKDGRVLASSENSVDTHSQFTRDVLLENCTRGMDLPLVFDTLDTIYRKIYYDEKNYQKMNTDSLVTVLFPFEQLLQDSSYVIEKSKNFRNNFPDVRLMIVSSGRLESFLPLVKNDKDLFSITLYPPAFNLKSVQEFADGVKQSYQRITRPSCGSYFDDQSSGRDSRVVTDVSPGNIVYYRLLPQYFYTQHGLVIVTIKSNLRAPLMICHSREMERPVGPTPRGGFDSNFNYNKGPHYATDFSPETYLHSYEKQENSEPEGAVNCKTITSDSYKIEMKNPCEGASNLQECPPLYISMTPPLQETASTICLTCKLPANVQYEISVTGLTCYNSATTILASPLWLSLVIFQFLKY